MAARGRGRCDGPRRHRRLRSATGRARPVEPLGRPRSRRQRLGVDRERLCSLPRLPCSGHLPAVLDRLLRRPALRAQGRLASDGARARPPQLSQLVPPDLSVRLRQVQDGRVTTPGARHERDFRAQFAAELRRDLALEPKQIQSKYLYDALGSSLFEAICRLPWYRITRAEHRLLELQAGAIVELASPRREATPLM